MSVKLLAENHLEFLSLTGRFTGLSEATFVKNATLLENRSLYPLIRVEPPPPHQGREDYCFTPYVCMSVCLTVHHSRECSS